MSQHFRLLNEAQVKSLLPMSDLIEAMENALARFSAGDVLQPVRTVLTVGPSKAFFGVMPAYVPQPAQLGAKLVTVFGGNETRGLPVAPGHHRPAGSRHRRAPGHSSTDATSPRRGPRPCRRSRPGTSRAPTRRRWPSSAPGVQARSHLEALAEVRALRESASGRPGSASRDRFVADMAGRTCRLQLRATATAEEAVRGADIVVLATSSPTPVFEDALGRATARTSSRSGACRPDQREMAPGAGRAGAAVRGLAGGGAGRVRRRRAWASGEGRFTDSHVAGELGQVVLGRVAGPQHRERRHDLQVARHGGGGRGGRRPGAAAEPSSRAAARNSPSDRLVPSCSGRADFQLGGTMKARRWAPIVFGVSVFVVFVGISAVVLGVAWFREHLSIEAASHTGAEAAFEEVRQRYRPKAPLLEMDGTSTTRRSSASRRMPPASLSPPCTSWPGMRTTRSSPASTSRSGCCA